MTADGFADVAEVVECGCRKATLYLANGYRLLHIDATSREATNSKTGQPFVLRQMTFVLGRPADVAHFTPPEMPRRES